MSNSKSYLRTEKLQQNVNLLIKEQTEQIKNNFNKIATLEPYLTDIDKRHRIKSKLTKMNKNKQNQSSQRSFRIKDVSTSSLHKLGFEKIDYKTSKLQRNKETINTTGTLINNKKIKPSNQHAVKERKSRSQQSRAFQSSFSRTINTRQQNSTTIKQTHSIRQQQQTSDKINFFNDYLLRANNPKPNKQHKLKFRKNLYQVSIPMKKHSGHQRNSQQVNNSSTQMSVKKISVTEINIDKNQNYNSKRKQDNDLMNGKKTQLVRKNNFRRAKYQVALHSSVQEKPENQDSEPLQSERKYAMNRKDSNLSINQEMDKLAENQMQKFYRQTRTKEIQKSLQKSTEKYFCNDSYRPIKSKNQIQIYVSTIINPSLHKVSQSTYDKSDYRNKSPLDLNAKLDFYAYNFDFEPDKKTINHKINEMENPSQQQSCSNLNESDFEQQRRNAQIEYFHKDHPQLDWSDDNCQVDDI